MYTLLPGASGRSELSADYSLLPAGVGPLSVNLAVLCVCGGGVLNSGDSHPSVYKLSDALNRVGTALLSTPFISSAVPGPTYCLYSGGTILTAI